MSQKRIEQIEQRIERIKKALLETGPMRPGSLTRQYKDPQNQTGAYWQISYTRQMKSRTEYVRQECVKELRRRIATHKQFRRLVDQWIDLSIEHSRLTMKMTQPTGK
jgi:sigma54-dependent transcription regulator